MRAKIGDSAERLLIGKAAVCFQAVNNRSNTAAAGYDYAAGTVAVYSQCACLGTPSRRGRRIGCNSGGSRNGLTVLNKRYVGVSFEFKPAGNGHRTAGHVYHLIITGTTHGDASFGHGRTLFAPAAAAKHTRTAASAACSAAVVTALLPVAAAATPAVGRAVQAVLACFTRYISANRRTRAAVSNAGCAIFAATACSIAAERTDAAVRGTRSAILAVAAAGIAASTRAAAAVNGAGRAIFAVVALTVAARWASAAIACAIHAFFSIIALPVAAVQTSTAILRATCAVFVYGAASVAAKARIAGAAVIRA